MVRIRLSRLGRTHRPFYRINAVEKREKRDGKILENLGWFNPVEKDPAKQLHLKPERIKHWIDQGAKPSDTLMDIFSKEGLVDADAWKATRDKNLARKKVLQAKQKAEAEAAAKAAAEAEAKAKAEEEKAAAEAAKAEAEKPAEEEAASE